MNMFPIKIVECLPGLFERPRVLLRFLMGGMNDESVCTGRKILAMLKFLVI